MSTALSIPAKEDAILAKLDRCREYLGECHSLEGVKEVRDIAEAAKVYAKRHGLGIEVAHKAAEYVVRAERRLGEILRATDRAKPPGDNQHKKQDRFQNGIEALPTLKELGIDAKTSMRSQKLADIPEPEFESRLDDMREAKAEPRATRMVSPSIVLPTAAEARAEAIRTGKGVVARDGVLYPPSTVEEEAQVWREVDQPYNFLKAITALRTITVSAAELREKGFEHMGEKFLKDTSDTGKILTLLQEWNETETEKE